MLMLTRFEKARVISARALQISLGAPILVKTEDVKQDVEKIVHFELKKGVLPLTVIREMPNGEKAFIDISKEDFSDLTENA